MLTSDPQRPRSGVYHDGKVYETDGELAIGIHEPGTLSLLSPLGAPPALRVIEHHRDSTGNPFPTYRYASPSGLVGPNAEIEVLGKPGSLDFAAHVAFVASETGAAIEPHEATTFVLGYCIVVFLSDDDLVQEERNIGIGTTRSHDLGSAIGPYLTTPEDLTEFSVGSNKNELVWNYKMRVNETVVAVGSIEGRASAPEALCFLSENRPVFAGEVIALAALEKPTVESVLDRPLMGGDRVEVTVDGLGSLVFHIA